MAGPVAPWFRRANPAQRQDEWFRGEALCGSGQTRRMLGSSTMLRSRDAVNLGAGRFAIDKPTTRCRSA